MAALSWAAETVWGAAGSCAALCAPAARTPPRTQTSPINKPSRKSARRRMLGPGRHRLFVHERLLVELQRELQVRRLILRKWHRIDARIARTAVRIALAANRRHQPFEAQITDAVGVEVLGDFLQRMRRGNELHPARRIDAVIAGRNRRR